MAGLLDNHKRRNKGLLDVEEAPGLLGRIARTVRQEYAGKTPQQAIADVPASMYENPLVNAAIGFTPVVGDIQSGVEALRSAAGGRWGEAALNGVGVLPFVPAMAGMIRTPFGRIPETGAEVSSLADMLRRAGERAGYVVNQDRSMISPSQYVTFTKAGDDLGETTRQVRISNHLDKHPELADGKRISVDPNADVTFEQAARWLNSEGFPTALSTRYKNIPTYAEYVQTQRSAAKAQQDAIEAAKMKFAESYVPTYGDYYIRSTKVNSGGRRYDVTNREGKTVQFFSKNIPEEIKNNPDRTVLYEELIRRMGTK